MKQSQQQNILAFFANAYGGDVPIFEGRAFLHLSYQEVKDLFRLKNRRKHYQLKKRNGGWILEPTSNLEDSLTFRDLKQLLLKAQKPLDSMDNILYDKEVDVGKRHPNIQVEDKKKTSNKKSIRFDWNDHYLEGLRIHGNKDDAEAHADEMKRKIIGRL